MDNLQISRAVNFPVGYVAVNCAVIMITNYIVERRRYRCAEERVSQAG